MKRDKSYRAVSEAVRLISPMLEEVPLLGYDAAVIFFSRAISPRLIFDRPRDFFCRGFPMTKESPGNLDDERKGVWWWLGPRQSEGVGGIIQLGEVPPGVILAQNTPSEQPIRLQFYGINSRGRLAQVRGVAIIRDHDCCRRGRRGVALIERICGCALPYHVELPPAEVSCREVAPKELLDCGLLAAKDVLLNFSSMVYGWAHRSKSGPDDDRPERAMKLYLELLKL